jgi:hypothetical protein
VESCYENINEIATPIECWENIEWLHNWWTQLHRVSELGGRAIAQAVSRWLPTVSAWVRLRVNSCGSVVDRAT